MCDVLRDRLSRFPKIDSLKPEQIEALESLLTGRNVLTIIPKGFGKSLIYIKCFVWRSNLQTATNFSNRKNFLSCIYTPGKIVKRELFLRSSFYDLRAPLFLGVLRSLEEDMIRHLHLTFVRINLSIHIRGPCRRRDNEFYWIRLIRLEIHIEKSLGRERAGSRVAIFFARISRFASSWTD